MRKIIKNKNLVPVTIADLNLDDTPDLNSTDPVTSRGVATAITEAVGGASDALQEQIDGITEKAGSGYTPKGPASVATLNGLSGQENGWLYTMTDAGTLTDGSLAVTAGDTVAWDEANSVWYPVMDYATKNEFNAVKNALPTKADKYVYKVFDFGNWELGAISSSGADVAATNRIRTALMAVGDVSKHLFINIPNGYYMIMACTNTTYTTSWKTGDNVEFVLPRYQSVRFAVKKSDESNLNYDTPNNIFNESGINCVGDRTYNLSDVVEYVKMNPLNVAGKKRHYYKFGGKGNDWCFVFTPTGYDPSRKKPYPFVICNHGNGYVYDGTPLNTFYTKKTMYLSSSDPNYNSDMTATEDSSLWYSNPTVEALLDEGYIVCGCENYGDNLYGNNDCRNACVDFFEHMVRSYNVTDYCYMIGCSNGAQTTLNASYLLQGKVRAIAILFPLCCLVNQYFSYSAQQAAIRLAYGITDNDIDEAGLVKATATHDFLHTSTSGNVRLDVFPAACVFYSLGDTTTLANQNAIPFINRLENSTKVVEYHECTGNHGDVSHFQPSVVVDFFGSN